MARRFIKKRTYRRKRRSFKKRNYKRKGHLGIGRARQRQLIVSDTQYVKLRWTKEYLLNTGTSAATPPIRGNSPWDPDSSVGTGQTGAVGFGQWRNFYKNFVVTASSIKAQFFNNPTGDSLATQLTVCPSTDVAVPPFAYDLPYAKSAFAGPKTSSKSVIYLKNYMTTQRIFGKKIMQEDSYAGQAGASPTDPIQTWYWHIIANDMLAGTNVNVAVRLIVKYYVKFYNRRDSNFVGEDTGEVAG